MSNILIVLIALRAQSLVGVSGLKVLSTEEKSCKVTTDKGRVDLSGVAKSDGSARWEIQVYTGYIKYIQKHTLRVNYYIIQSCYEFLFKYRLTKSSLKIRLMKNTHRFYWLEVNNSQWQSTNTLNFSVWTLTNSYL